MKFKVLSRREVDYTRERRSDVVKVQRNPDPLLHPFEQAREYTRALNAAKLQKIFAKPFVGALDGHMDGVFSMATNPKSLVTFVSGSCDGELRVWDLSHRKTVWSTEAHAGFVRGLSVSSDGSTFFSCGDDKLIKRWAFDSSHIPLHMEEAPDDEEAAGLTLMSSKNARFTEDRTADVAPVSSFAASYPVQGISCHWEDDRFVTCGATLDVWDGARNEPVHTFKWGADSVTSVQYNPAERDLIAATGTDRSIALYDARASTPLRKLVLNMRSNALAWNPMEPFNFVVANEDHNCYSFDMRRFDRATMVHKDHVSAVMDVSFSPTGREFVTGSYDRTVRIFKYNRGRSHEVYHTRRMQRVFCAEFTGDSTYVLSGSDDTNIRIWKAKASKRLGTRLPRQRAADDYSASLLDRYKNMKEISRIRRHRHVPKAILKATQKERVMHEARTRRSENRISHSKPGTEEAKRTPEREKAIVKEIE